MNRFLNSVGLVLVVAACSPSGPARIDAAVVFFDGGTDTADSGVDAGLDAGPADSGSDTPEDGGLSSCTMNSECDDGVFCNGDEQCAAGECVAGDAPDCDDAVA
ncbi:MAG: hypothetical protein ACI9KE_001798, partial [Polyangiales bacterium]